MSFTNPTTHRIAAFLSRIGIPVTRGSVTGAEFLSGIRVSHGELIVDEARLEWPGDLLHEAAHLAMIPRDQRLSHDLDAAEDGGAELGSIAWSWAALVHLDLAPEIVFHPAGYRGASASIIENFRQRRYIGLPYLQWIGLANHEFPAMIRWLRD